MFTTTVGTRYESHDLRRDFRRVTAAAGIGARWVPKELRTSFVSMMSCRATAVRAAPNGQVCVVGSWLACVAAPRRTATCRRRSPSVS